MENKKSKTNLKSTVIKTTPIDEKATEEIKSTLNVNNDFEIEHLHKSMEDIKDDIYSDVNQSLVKMSGDLEKFEMPDVVIEYERARENNEVEKITVTNATDALEALKKAASQWKKDLVTFINGMHESKQKKQAEEAPDSEAIQHTQDVTELTLNDAMNALKAQMNAIETSLSKIQKDKKKKKKTSKKSRKSKKDDAYSSDESSLSSKSSNSTISNSDDGDGEDICINNSSSEVTIVCETISSSCSRRIAGLSDKPSDKLNHLVATFIRQCESGNSEKAEEAKKQIFKEASQGLVIGASGAGGIPMQAAMKHGAFRSKGEVSLKGTTISALSGTGAFGNAHISDDDTSDIEDGMKFEAQPVDQEKYVRESIDRAASMTNFGAGIRRKNLQSKIVIDPEVVMSLEERKVAQSRIYNAFKKVLEKSPNKELPLNVETYKGFLKVVKEYINNKNGIVPAGCYEKPTEITVILAAAKPGMFTGSYLIAAIQKFNSEVASGRYFMQLVRYLGPEGQIKEGESARGYINRILAMVGDAKSQTPPTDLSKLGIELNDRKNHPFLDERLVVLIVMQQLYSVLGTQQGGKEVRTYITEEMMKLSYEGKLTKEDLEKAIDTMTKDKVGMGSKEKVPQTQTFGAYQKESTSSSKKNNQTNGNIKKSDESYSKAVASIGNNFEHVKDRIIQFNKRNKKHFFINIQNKPLNEVTINPELGDWYRLKDDLFNKLNEDDKGFILLVHDLYSQGKRGELSKRGLTYQNKVDSEWSSKLTKWRKSHKIKPANPRADVQVLSSEFMVKRSKKKRLAAQKKNNKKKASESSDSEDGNSGRSGYSSTGFDDENDSENDN